MMPRYFRRSTAAAIGLALAAQMPAAGPARAQEDYERIVMTMRACAGIEDMAARVMCYDNNVAPRSAGDGIAPPPLPPAAPRPGGGAQAEGFGSEMVRPAREDSPDAAPDEMRAEVAQVERLAPGILLLTLADGAQWRFVDAAPLSYDAPRAGATVAFERGSLGSVFLSYQGQRRLRVIRVR